MGIFYLPWVMLLAGLQGILGWVLVYKLKIPLLNTNNDQSSDLIPSNAIPFGVFLAVALIQVSVFLIVKNVFKTL